MTTETETSPKSETEPKGITPEPLVDLDAIDSEQTVRYGGKLYRIRLIGEFGIGKQQKMNRDGREFFRLYNSDEELSDTDEQRLSMLLERMFSEVLDAPVSIKRKLTDSQKAAVVLGFTLAPSISQAAQAILREARDTDPLTTGS